MKSTTLYTKTLVHKTTKNSVLLTGNIEEGSDCCLCWEGGGKRCGRPRVPSPLLPTGLDVRYVFFLLLTQGGWFHKSVEIVVTVD